MKPTPHQQRQGQRGVALIEALIGILIFAFGVLGLIGLQATMTRSQTSGKFRADAANLVADLFGMVQTDHLSNMRFYEEGPSTHQCKAYPRCAEWMAKAQRVLPTAEVVVKVDTSNGTVTAEVSWKQGSEDRNKYVSTMTWQQ